MFKVLNEHYIQNEATGEHLNLNDACDLLNQLSKENRELKSIKTFAERNGINIFNIDEAFRRCWNDNGELVKENGELKQRLNDFKHEIHRLKHELKCATIDSSRTIERLERLNELKKEEIQARVNTLNVVCNKYLNMEILFKNDVNPNDAVQQVVREILHTNIEF